MASDEPPPYGRSSSRATRTFQDTVTSDQKPLVGAKKPQLKLVSDKRLWFSPVHSPLLSPAREKTLLKKKTRQSSIFSIQTRGKGSIVAEEPISPKVSCIGQVRGHQKSKDAFADALRKKSSQSRRGSMSPARFFASPGRPTWGSLFGSRKDPCTINPSSFVNGQDDLSFSRVSLDAHTPFQTDKACSFLERCPDLSQGRCDSNNHCDNQEMYPGVDALHSRFEEQDIHATTNRCIDAVADEKIGSHPLTSARSGHLSHKNGAGEVLGDAMVAQNKISEAWHHPTAVENLSQADCRDEINSVLRQRLNYEDLPSLHCGAIMKQNMKISIEVVPETWLWRNGEELTPDSSSHLNCILNQSISTSREDHQNNQNEEPILPMSPCGDSQVTTRGGDDFVDSQILPGQSRLTGCRAVEGNNRTNNVLMNGSINSANICSCKPLDAGGEKTLIGAEHSLTTAPSGSGVMELPFCTYAVGNNEKMEEFCAAAGGTICSQSETNRSQIGKQQAHLEQSRNENNADKNRGVKEHSEPKTSHQAMRRVGVDLGKENYGITFSPVLGRSLPAAQSKEDGNLFWSRCKGRKAEASSKKQPLNTLILVECDQLAAPKNLEFKDEELLRGILEVGGLSFYGSGKFFRVLNSDAAFNRSRSATSVRTVIRLQRCNSDPCRPSFY